MNKVTTAERSLKIRKSDRFLALKNLDNLKVFVLLAITIWIAYFWHSASFGLYSDDLWRIVDAMGMTWSELGSMLLDLFLMKIGQGRPLHDGLIYLGSFIGFRLGGLHVIYWIGYVILTVNAFLFYTLLKRLSDQQVFAVTGALAFCLFPTHTVQAYLTIDLGVQPSLMLLLIAIHCYFSERKKLSYLFILGSLFCYETFFPLFLAVPLFKQKWNSRLMGKLIKHGLVLGGMLVCVALLRKLTGENRVANLDLLDVIKTSIQHMYIGPIVNLKTFLTRPFITLGALVGQERLKELWIFLPLCFAGFFYALSRLKLSLPRNVFRLKTAFDSKVLHLETAELFDHFAKLALIGSIMLVLAYPFTLVNSPYIVNRVGSRINLAGSFGASILIGCICSIVLLLAAAYGRKLLATVGLAAFFALLVGFGLIVQQDYRLAWQYQRQYWTDAIKLIPDLDEETVFCLDEAGLWKTKYMNFTLADARTILPRLYQFPDDWEINKQPLSLRQMLNWSRMLRWTSAYVMKPNWQENIALNGNSFELNRFVWLRPGEKTATGLPPFEKGPLYDYLIKSPDEERINYVDESANSNKSSRSMLITEERQ